MKRRPGSRPPRRAVATPPPEPSEVLRAGARVGRLRVEGALGSGASGSVFRAFDPLLQRHVALKVLRAPERDVRGAWRTRAITEARHLASLDAPNVVRLHDVHELDGGCVAIELELLEGGTLTAQLADGRPHPIDAVVRVARDLLAALVALHDRGFVHCDIKPSNLLFTAEGRLKVADLGSVVTLAGGGGRSRSVKRWGTPTYAAPESHLGLPACSASDVWSAAVVVYELLAGRPPFTGPGLPALFSAVVNAEPPPLPGTVPEALRRLVVSSLAKAPDRRPTARQALELVSEGSLDPATAPTSRVRSSVLGGLVGRAAERSRVEGLWPTSGEAGRIGLLCGAAGMGKTALVRAAKPRALARGCAWVEFAVEPEVGLGALFRQGLALAPSPSGSLEPAAIADRIVAGMGVSGVCLVVEDIQNLRREDLLLLQRVWLQVRARPVTLLVTMRAAEAGTVADPAVSVGLQDFGLDGLLPAEEVVALQPLLEEEVLGLLESVSGGSSVDPTIARSIARTSGGNPLHAIELLHHMRAAGLVHDVAGRIEPTVEWDEARLPPSFDAMARARFGRLEDQDRAVLEVASCEGVAFDGEAVAAVLGLEPIEALRRMQGLTRRSGLLRAAPRGYSFEHALLRDVVYASLGPAYRKRIHERLAAWAEEQGRLDEPERLGSHWEAAGRPDRARPHLLRALAQAAEQQSIGRALALSGRVGLAPATITPAEALAHRDLVLRLITTYGDAGRFEDCLHLEAALHQGARDVGDDQTRYAVVAEASHFRYLMRGRDQVDIAALEEAAARLDVPRWRGRAYYVLGVLAKYRGDREEARVALERASALFEEARHPGLRASCLDQLASLLRSEGKSDQAIDLYAQSAHLSASVGRRANAAATRVNLALARFDQGAYDDVLPLVEDARRTFLLEGSPWQADHATVILAALQHAFGQYASASRLLDAALPRLATSGYLGALAEGLLLRAWLRVLEGDLGDGLLRLRRAREAIDRLDNPARRLQAWGCEAQVQTILGEHATAQSLLARGMHQVGLLAAQRSEAPILPGLRDLASSAYFGLDTGPWADALARALATVRIGGVEASLDAAQVEGALAMGNPGAPAESLRQAAAALDALAHSAQRPEHRVRSAWLRAAAARRDGDTRDAGARLRTAAEDARVLGHPWLELAILGDLAQLGADPSARARAGARAEACARLQSEPGHAGRILQMWKRGP